MLSYDTLNKSIHHPQERMVCSFQFSCLQHIHAILPGPLPNAPIFFAPPPRLAHEGAHAFRSVGTACGLKVQSVPKCTHPLFASGNIVEDEISTSKAGKLMNRRPAVEDVKC